MNEPVQQGTKAVVDYQVFEQLNTHIIYMMGGCFILGSALTVITLLLLDFIRSRSQR